MLTSFGDFESLIFIGLVQLDFKLKLARLMNSIHSIHRVANQVFNVLVSFVVVHTFEFQLDISQMIRKRFQIKFKLPIFTTVLNEISAVFEPLIKN